MSQIFGYPSSVERPTFSGLTHERDQPAIRIDGFRDYVPFRETVPLRDLAISIARLKARRCTGYFDLDDYSACPCPDAAKLVEGASSDQCPACFRRSGFNPAFYNVERSTLSERQQRYNARPHLVYIAGFGARSLKVGMSSQDRIRVRLREQGALAARIIGHSADAYAARALEARVVRDGDVRETCSHHRKIRNLVEGVAQESTDGAVDALCHRLVRDAVIDMPPTLEDCRPWLAENRRAAGIAAGATDHSDVRPLALVGTMLGAIGSIIVIASDRGMTLLVDSRKLTTHRLDHAATTLGDIVPVQTALL